MLVLDVTDVKKLMMWWC